VKEHPSPDPTPSLTVWGGGAASTARVRQRDGALVVVWPGADPAALVRSGVPTRPVEALLGHEGLGAVEAAARTWARLWGRVPLMDGSSFRDLATWRETSLLWLAEGFVLRETAGPRCARLAEMSLRLLEATGAAEVDAIGLPDPDAVLLARACTAAGVLFHGTPPRARPVSRGPTRRGPGALEGMLAPREAPPLPPALVGGTAPGGALILVVTDGEATALGPLVESAARELPAAVVIVTTAMLGRWRTRRVVRQGREAAGRLRELWERIRAVPGVLESYRHRDVGFSDLAADDLRQILLVHLPRAVMQLESAIEMLRVAPRPAVLVVNVQERDERRALVAAAAVAAVPTAILHSGPADGRQVERQDGGPQARATLVWQPGSETGPTIGRLGEVVRASVEPE